MLPGVKRTQGINFGGKSIRWKLVPNDLWLWGPYLHVLADDGEWPCVPWPLVFLLPSLQSSVSEGLKGWGRCGVQNGVGPAKNRQILALGMLCVLRLLSGRFCSLQKLAVITDVMLFHYYLGFSAAQRAACQVMLTREETNSISTGCFLRNRLQNSSQTLVWEALSSLEYSHGKCQDLPDNHRMLTNITWAPVHVTDHGLVVQSLGIKGYREFSLTFVAQAVASAGSWGLSLGIFQGSCAQNSFYPLVGTWHTQPCCPCIFQCCLFPFPPPWEFIPPGASC